MKLENKSRDSHWISISDMMSGLMVVFLFIAISYMIEVIKEKENIKEIAVTYNRLQDDLYNELYNEFHEHFEEWGCSMDRKTLSIRFDSPEILFQQNSSKLSLRFQVILESFFTRYIEKLLSEKYVNDIEEIRIEGHTSSEWETQVSEEEAYINNMKLSQDRTRSVLNYVISMPYSIVRENSKWIREHLTANGLSSSKIIVENGLEDRNRSRRVEFRVKTKAEEQILKIIQQNGNNIL